MASHLRSPDHRVEMELARIGDNVRDRRAALDRSQSWLAGAAGLDQSTISRLECGFTAGLRLERYARVMAVLRQGVPLDAWQPPNDDEVWLRRLRRRGPKREILTGLRRW